MKLDKGVGEGDKYLHTHPLVGGGQEEDHDGDHQHCLGLDKGEFFI